MRPAGAAALEPAGAAMGGAAARVTAALVAVLTVGLAVSISLAEVTLAALALWLVAARRGRRSGGWPLLVPVAGFALWTVVSALASARPVESLGAAKSLLTLGTLYVLVHALPDAAAARRFALGLFAAVSVVAVLAIVQVGLCHRVPENAVPLLRFFHKCDRAHGFYSIYMTLAGVLTLVLVSALPRVLGAPRAPWWSLPAWLVGVVALALTAVRGAWLGFLAGAAGSVVLGRRRLVALAGLAGLGLLVLVALPQVRERARTLGDPRDPTARDRLAMWRGGLAIARDHWLTGVGPGMVKHVYPSYAPPDALRRSTSHVHNTPLQILAERGVPGLAAWIVVFGVFFARAIRALRRLPLDARADRCLVAGSVLAIAAFLVAGLFEYNFGDTEVLLVACALMALPFVIGRDHERASVLGDAPRGRGDSTTVRRDVSGSGPQAQG